jgi:hypothetical protein
MSKKDDMRATYEKWWLGKLCRPRFDTGPFSRVVKLELVGPPSFVCGVVIVTFEDGATGPIQTDPFAFRPRKSDMEVQND